MKTTIPCGFRRGLCLAVWLLAVALLLAGPAAQAFLWGTVGMWPYIPQNGSKHGAVYARQLVPGPQGQPVYVEFDPATGAEGREIGEAVGDFAGAQVLAASEYRAWLTRLTDLRQRYPALELVDAADYRGASYATAAGQVIAKPRLAAGTLWVALRPPALRYTPDPAQLVLLELPIDPGQTLGYTSTAVLLDPRTGAILHQSANNIGYRVGFYGDAANPAKVPGRGSDWRRDPDDLIYGPLAAVPVEIGYGLFGAAVTDDQGKYHAGYRLPPCPGFTFEYSTPVNLELYYSRFNPRGSRTRGYTLQRPGYDVCNGHSVWTGATFGIVATMATPAQYNTDFAIDLMILSGRGHLTNPDGSEIPLGAAIAYDHRQPALARVAQNQYDLDGDGIPDIARLGRQDTIDGETRFVPMEAAENPPLQGVWLSGVHGGAPDPAVTPPDLTRLADWGPDFEDRGLLSRLRAADLEDTDLYVVRESDGSLIAERKGLGADELIADLAGADADANRYDYTVHLLGDTFSRFAAGGDDGSRTEFSQWQAAGGMNPKLFARSADHLRPGERVRLIAINRASGYQGSLTTELKAAGSGGDARQITFPIDELVMGPPNLRLWAERQFTVAAGLTKGERRDYRIGQEGAAAANDTVVVIYSEWLDRDGRPLPAALGDYGYTARLAQVIAPNTLAPVGGSSVGGERLAHFPIRPGHQVQVVRLPEPTLGSQHLYLQVNGQPHTRNPDFGSSGAGPGALQHRPDRSVPVQVPVFDETATQQATQVYNQLRKADPDTERPQPEPLYRWVYRPEFQFSIYDLKLREVRRQDLDGRTQDLLPLKLPVIAGGDRLVDLYYDLLAPEYPPLTPYSYSGERELVLALGEQEASAVTGQDRTLGFDNLGQLAALNPADYLSLRLYSNNDSANVLYEWVFAYIAGAPDSAWLSADAPSLGLVVSIPGVQDAAVTLQWTLAGPNGAQLASASTRASFGVFTNILTASRHAGDGYVVTARVVASESPQTPIGAQVRLGPFTVVPGEPNRIDLDTDSVSLVADETGTTAIAAQVFDAHDNPVADETPVSWSLDYDGDLEGQETATSGGVVRVEYRVGDRTGPSRVTASAGQAELTLEIAKTALVAELVASATDLVAGSADTVTLNVRAPGEDGTPVSWGATRGQWVSREETLSGGQASAVLAAAAEPGDGLVNVSVAGAVADIGIRHRGTTGAELDLPAIVDAESDGSVVVDGLNGPVSHTYVASTGVTVRGLSGETLTLAPGGFFTPNAVPTLHLAMNGEGADAQGNREILGETGGAAALVGEVAFDDTTAFTRPGRSLAFSGGYLLYTPQTPLPLGEGLFVNLRFRVAALGSTQTLAHQAGAGGDDLQLEVTPEGYLLARLRTASGTYEVRSPTPVEVGRWHIGGLRVRDGALEVGLDHARARTPMAGQALTSLALLAIGDVDFRGHIDDVKLGQERPDNALLVFGDGSLRARVTLDASGQGRVAVRATGRGSQRGQTIGLSRVDTASAQGRTQTWSDLVIAAASGLLGIGNAYAEPLAGQQEAGLAVAKPAEWGTVAEWLGQRAFGDYWGNLKQIAEFVYQLTAVSDIVTLMEAVYNLAKGDVDKVDGFEVTFAAIGIGATALALMTTGGAAMPAFKAGLSGIRPVLKELFNTGAREALQTGVLLSKYLFQQIRHFVSNPGMALDELKLFAAGLSDTVLDASGNAIRTLFRSVRSLDDLNRWVKLRAFRDICLVDRATPTGVLYAGWGGAAGDRLATSLDALLALIGDGALGARVYAAGCGSYLTEYLDSLRGDIARFGDSAKANRAVASLETAMLSFKEAGIVLSSRRAYEVMADIAHHGDPAFIKDFADNVVKKFRDVDGKPHLDFHGNSAMVEELFHVLGKIPPDVENYRAFVKPLGDNNAYMIRGRYVEAKALDETAEEFKVSRGSIGLDDRINEEYINGRGQLVRPGANGHEATDGVFPLADGKTLWLESKNWARPGDAAEIARRWEALDDQFRKHINTRILLLYGDIGPARFADSMPRLRYHLEGSFWDGVSSQAIADRFNNILASEYRKLHTDGFQIQLNDVIVRSNTNHPLVY